MKEVLSSFYNWGLCTRWEHTELSSADFLSFPLVWGWLLEIIRRQVSPRLQGLPRRFILFLSVWHLLISIELKLNNEH